MIVNKVSNSKRCEICHQIDLYNDREDFCSRCGNLALIKNNGIQAQLPDSESFAVETGNYSKSVQIKKTHIFLDKMHISKSSWMPEVSKMILKHMIYSNVIQRVNRSTTCRRRYRQHDDENNMDYTYSAHNLLKELREDWVITQDINENLEKLTVQDVADNLKYLYFLGYIRNYQKKAIRDINFFTDYFIVLRKGEEVGDEVNSFGFKFRKNFPLSEASVLQYEPGFGISFSKF